MAKILVYSDKAALALELLTAAGEIGQPVKAVTINDQEQAQLLANAGAEVYNISNGDIALADVVSVTTALAEAVDKLDADIILLSSNRRGREVAGRLAQKLNAGCLTDVNAVEVNGDRIFCRRNALGGATVATQVITSSKKVIAISPRSFEAASGSGGSVNELQVGVIPASIKIIEVKPKTADAVDIAAANILVAVGQGLNSQKDLAAVEALAKKLGGEVACSKPVATDKKWLSEDRIIGLSGKICKPDLVIAMGISGQVQFAVGIRDAKTIVSVNNDENASLNMMADYILVSDLHPVVDELNSKLG